MLFDVSAELLRNASGLTLSLLVFLTNKQPRLKMQLFYHHSSIRAKYRVARIALPVARC